MSKFHFSGHESFNCRPLWLKKGVDLIDSGSGFASEEALIQLGVGKNMVNSINYWVQAFGLMNEEKKLSEIAEYLFGKNGKDPYLENPASLWILHYYLVISEKASLYSLFFNLFRKERIEFNSKMIANFLKNQCELSNTFFNENTTNRDINVFLKNYLKPVKSFKNLEDEYSGLFIDLNILERLERDYNNDRWFKVVITDRKEIPSEILLFFIIEQAKDNKSISLQTLLKDYGSIGNIIPITESGMIDHITILQEKYNQLVFKEDAGIKELQFKSRIDKWKILNNYYD